MKVLAFLHAKLDVTDMARSEEFYCGLLGLHEIVRYSIPNNGVILQLSPNGQPPGVELWYEEPIGQAPDTKMHIAFAVDDTRAWVENLRPKGVRIEKEPFAVANEVIAFIRDPDGYLIELNEVRK
jgi:catechol 2,3-dioxygenase-like lactoylglutathione lyase family enzyme